METKSDHKELCGCVQVAKRSVHRATLGEKLLVRLEGHLAERSLIPSVCPKELPRSKLDALTRKCFGQESLSTAIRTKEDMASSGRRKDGEIDRPGSCGGVWEGELRGMEPKQGRGLTRKASGARCW